MAFAGRLRHWFVEFLVRGAHKQLRVVKKMDRRIKRLGIPMLPRAKTQRGELIRAVLLWIVVVVLFVLLGRFMLA
jgi:hypothetical protein